MNNTDNELEINISVGLLIEVDYKKIETYSLRQTFSWQLPYFLSKQYLIFILPTLQFRAIFTYKYCIRIVRITNRLSLQQYCYYTDNNNKLATNYF